MYLNQRIFLLLALILPSAFLSAQNLGSAPQAFYEVISDPAEVAKIRKKCQLEAAGLESEWRYNYWDSISVTELKALLKDSDPEKNERGLSKIGYRLVQEVQPKDSEILRLVFSFFEVNDIRQASAFWALIVLDPEIAAGTIIEIIKNDNLSNENRLYAKKILGATIPTKTTIDFLKGLLLQEKRSIFEREDSRSEVHALIGLYTEATSKQREEIVDFVMAYLQNHPEVEKKELMSQYLYMRWSANPEPKYLKLMEEKFIEGADGRYFPNHHLLPGILKLKGKKGDDFVEKIIDNSGDLFYDEILIWAHANKKLRFQEMVLKSLTNTERKIFFEPNLGWLWKIGGQEMMDQYLSYFENEDRQMYQKRVQLELAPIRKLSDDETHPLRRIADTLFKKGFFESPLSNTEIETLRDDEYHRENPNCVCSVIKRLPCYYPEDDHQYYYFQYLSEALIPATGGALDGLEFLEYHTDEIKLDWYIFKGKAYRYLKENFAGHSEEAYIIARAARSKFYSLNWLLELHGIEERFYEIPESFPDKLGGGFYTTPEKAQVLFSLIGRDPWKQ